MLREAEESWQFAASAGEKGAHRDGRNGVDRHGVNLSFNYCGWEIAGGSGWEQVSGLPDSTTVRRAAGGRLRALGWPEVRIVWQKYHNTEFGFRV